jgi:hypothetical protein
LHNSLQNNSREMEKTIVKEMKKRIDAEIARGGMS